MKQYLRFSLLLSCLSVAVILSAQNPVATLQHKGTTSVFYGQSAFSDGYNAATKGDTLYLSAGYFAAPTALAKGINVIGSGHFPDSTGVVSKRTTILSDLNIKAGADSLYLEGLFISGNGNIYYQGDASINYVKVIRCNFNQSYFSSTSNSTGKNYCSFEECYVRGGINFYNYGINLLVRHCIFNSTVSVGYYVTAAIGNINGGALIDGNIFLADNYVLGNVYSSLIQNNIMYSGSLYSSTGNTFKNNTIAKTSVDFGTNSNFNNYLGVLLTNIFVKQSGNTIDYTHDYHLKDPTAYLGTDGTQIGIYGGDTPFKVGGTPSNPQITKKSIATKTDASGNLQVSFSAKAQDR